jgi:hypothetical protein
VRSTSFPTCPVHVAQCEQGCAAPGGTDGFATEPWAANPACENC